MRVKIIKDHPKHKKGITLNVSPNEGFGLIDSGYAILTRDVTEQDFKTKVKVKKRG